MKRFVVVGVLASSLLLAGCSANAGESSIGAPGSGSAIDSGMVVSPGVPELGQGDTSKVNSDGSLTSESSISADSSRSVVKTAAVEVAVDSPLSVSPALLAIAKKAGGYVQDSSASPANEYQRETAYATLRVPADKLDAATQDVECMVRSDSVALALQARPVVFRTDVVWSANVKIAVAASAVAVSVSALIVKYRSPGTEMSGI
jgi:hypothetical protein